MSNLAKNGNIVSVYVDNKLFFEIREYIREKEKIAGCTIVQSVILRDLLREGLSTKKMKEKNET